jgi:hypothetical protein
MFKKSGEGDPLKPITSRDGLRQISIPSSWKEDPALHQEAELQASDRANEMYIIVLAESKEDFDAMDIDKYSEIIRTNALQTITSAQVSTPATTTINGYPARQCEIRGTVDNLKVAYIQSAVETPKHFYQILSWTLASRFDKNKSELEKVINSFKEVGATGTK